MANYDYVCVTCNNEEERNVPMDDRENQRCNYCNSELKRVFSFRGVVWAPTSTNGGMK